MRACKKCKKEKHPEFFYAHKNAKDKLQSVCKTCWDKRSKEYRQKRREEINKKACQYKKRSRRSIPARFTVLSYNSKRRGIDFSLTLSEYKELASMECHYCGDRSSIEGSTSGGYLDRIDNLFGYTLENVRPCCGLCNKLKSDLKESVFIEQINKIVLRGKNGFVGAEQYTNTY